MNSWTKLYLVLLGICAILSITSCIVFTRADFTLYAYCSMITLTYTAVLVTSLTGDLNRNKTLKWILNGVVLLSSLVHSIIIVGAFIIFSGYYNAELGVLGIGLVGIVNIILVILSIYHLARKKTENVYNSIDYEYDKF